MNIVMFTNTYAPMVGGAEKSVEVFCEDLRELGHNTLVVTPAFKGAEDSTDLVLRLPSIKKVAMTRYSLCLPAPQLLKTRLEAFEPDILHAHQPFHLGDTALRYGRRNGLPVIFTHHTLYERYVENIETDTDLLRRFVTSLPTEYANLCDAVIAPTPSIEQLIRERGVERPIFVAPTGIDVDFFAAGDRGRARQRWDLDEDHFVVGHVGRLIPAKNLMYLAEAVAAWLEGADDRCRFLLVGEGESAQEMMDLFGERGVADRVVRTGALSGQDLADAYAAMDLFAFSSQTDTQGLVLVEAMSAGAPVVALDAPGARDVVERDKTGLLLDTDAEPEAFAEALAELADDPDRVSALSDAARQAARRYDRTTCAKRLAGFYRQVIDDVEPPPDDTPWQGFVDRVEVEWDLFSRKMYAAATSLFGTD